MNGQVPIADHEREPAALGCVQEKQAEQRKTVREENRME
jgi:hypothetical protein